MPDADLMQRELTATKSKRHLCPYSLTELGEDGTKEHVIARSWLPSQLPANFINPTVTVSKSANNRKSRLEENILRSVVASVNSSDERFQKLYERHLRAMNPEFARDNNDAVYRQRTKKRFIDRIISIDENPEIIEYCLRESKKNYMQGSRLAVLVPAYALDELISYWIRGIHNYFYGSVIEFEEYILPIPSIIGMETSWIDQFSPFCTEIGTRDVISITHGYLGHDSFVYALHFWGSFSVSAMVSPVVAEGS